MVKREENYFHFFIELLLEYATVNETGAFGIPPYKGNRGQYFAYTLPFYEQSVYKNTVLRDYIGNVNASPKKPGGRGLSGLHELTE